jgi:hypothetical protein
MLARDRASTIRKIKESVACPSFLYHYIHFPEKYGYGIMYASDKTKRRGTRHLVFRRDNEQTVCEADNEHEVRVCEYASVDLNTAVAV